MSMQGSLVSVCLVDMMARPRCQLVCNLLGKHLVRQHFWKQLIYLSRHWQWRNLLLSQEYQLLQLQLDWAIQGRACCQLSSTLYPAAGVVSLVCAASSCDWFSVASASWSSAASVCADSDWSPPSAVSAGCSSTASLPASTASDSLTPSHLMPLKGRHSCQHRGQFRTYGSDVLLESRRQST